MTIQNPRVFSILLLLILFTYCVDSNQQSVVSNLVPVAVAPPAPQVAEYVRHIFEDTKGNIWIGTGAYGVACYDGDSLSYYTEVRGFGGRQITGITEDVHGDLWFATDLGIVRYKSNSLPGVKEFVNYSSQNFFEGQRFWSVFADSKGIIWAGASRGIFRFDGMMWVQFELPYPEDITGEFITQGTTWSITEDRSGHIWFSTNGHGVFAYDGKSFTQYTTKEGLADNSVDVIFEDRLGVMWFGTRWGGVSRYDGKTFTNYNSTNAIGNDEVCEIYEDKEGNIWLSSEGYGVYKYDGNSFTNYGEDEGLGVRAVQTICEDNKGRLWVGGGGGLYRLLDDAFVNVTKNGPW